MPTAETSTAALDFAESTADEVAEECLPPAILPYITFLISTYNRKEILLRTLTELQQADNRCALVTETIVIDNASTDGSADAVAARFPAIRLFRETKNRGACAKNIGLSQAMGRFVIFLDDDSYPDADSLRRMVEYFQADKKLGAAVFNIVLPDGSRECSAYPNVFIGCGTGFRREALVEVGGLPNDYFMQAEEYDLSLRLIEAGWDIRRFEDLRVSHLKTPGARQPTRTTRLDVRNNLTLITRYFPRQWMYPFAIDWMRRYRWIAKEKGWRHHLAFWRGLIEGLLRSLRPGHRRAISLAVFERFARIRDIRQQLDRAVKAGGYRSIILIDVGKNILPYYLAAASAGIEILAIADPRLARHHRCYRGIPIVDDAQAQQLNFDAAVIANLSPVHAADRRKTWRKSIRRPVLDLFEQPQTLALVA